jgi:hypothetical protein
MLALWLTMTAPPAASVPVPPLSLTLPLSRCDQVVDRKADITVCGRRTPSYRIDPRVLAADRIVNAPPPNTRNGLREVTAPSCHDEPKKCEGREIIPLLPVALKTLEVATLAAQGQDWRAALRTRPDGWEAYQSQMKRGAKPKVCIGLCSRRP